MHVNWDSVGKEEGEKGYWKANILVSASKLNKHLLEDPINFGRRDGESFVVLLA